MVKITSVRRFMVSMSPSVVTHVISADGYVIVPAPRLILSLLISPDVSDFSLSNQINNIQISGVASGGSAGFLPYVQL